MVQHILWSNGELQSSYAQTETMGKFGVTAKALADYVWDVRREKAPGYVLILDVKQEIL